MDSIKIKLIESIAISSSIDVIIELLSYSGFDDWWDALYEVDQNPIKDSIKEIIYSAIEKYEMEREYD